MSTNVIIPVFNRPEYTELLLKSLYKEKHGAKIAPIIVDNCCRNSVKKMIVEWINAHDPSNEEIERPRLIECVKNIGFGGALNAAIDTGLTKYVVIMHNDTVVFPGWLGAMLEVMEKNSDEAAVVVPRTCYANEWSPCIGDIREKYQKIKPPNKDRLSSQEVEKIFSDFYSGDKTMFTRTIAEKYQMDSTYSPEMSSFCCLTRSEYFDKYGKFDEDFWPRGFEDKFWFRQIERDGWISLIANRAYVHHWGNITSDGPGFSFPDNMKMNNEKYKQKCLDQDRLGVKADNTEKMDV